jgi:hypothetical protein
LGLAPQVSCRVFGVWIALALEHRAELVEQISDAMADWLLTRLPEPLRELLARVGQDLAQVAVGLDVPTLLA